MKLLLGSRIPFILAAVAICACSEDAAPPSNPTPPAPTATPPPMLYTVTGVVMETAPTTSTAITGATVRVVDGPNAGLSTTTNSAGSYTLSGLQFAGFSVNASANGYVETGRGIALTSGVATTTASFQLQPNPRVITETLTGTISGGDMLCGTTITKPCKIHSFNIHHNGAFTVRLTWNTGADLDLDFFRGTTRIAESNGVRSSEEISANIQGGFAYDLRVIYYSGALITGYTAQITRMN